MPASSRSALGRPLVRMQSIITAAELTAAGTAQSLSLGTIPTDAVIEEVWHETPTLLADAGSISAVTMQVGTSGAAAYLIAATSVFTGGAEPAPARACFLRLPKCWQSSPQPAQTLAPGPQQALTPEQ